MKLAGILKKNQRRDPRGTDRLGLRPTPWNFRQRLLKETSKYSLVQQWPKHFNKSESPLPN